MRRYKPIYANTPGRRWLRRFIKLLILLLIAGLAAGGYWFWRHQRNQVTNGLPVRGIAVDQDDGYLDFDALGQKVQFVYMRATQGSSYIDDNFSTNYSRATGRSLAVGVYHVFSFSSSGKDQASYFTKQVTNQTGTLPIAIQVNYYGNYNADNLHVKKVQRQLKALIVTLNQVYNRTCVIWTTPAIAKKVVKPVIKHTQLMYDTTATHSQPKRVVFMHYSDDAKYRIDNTTVSLNGLLYNGTQQQFNRYLRQQQSN